MGSSHSHPMFPPSPMPHTKSGPPPRPNFSGHRPGSKQTQIHSNASSSSLTSLLPSVSPSPSTSSLSTSSSPRPGFSTASTRSSSPFRPFSRSSTKSSSPSAPRTKPSFSPFKKRDKKTLDVCGGKQRTGTWEIGPHSRIMNLDRGKARTWGGPGREYTKTAEETEVNRVKGRWANRVKIGEEGEAWFY